MGFYTPGMVLHEAGQVRDYSWSADVAGRPRVQFMRPDGMSVPQIILEPPEEPLAWVWCGNSTGMAPGEGAKPINISHGLGRIETQCIETPSPAGFTDLGLLSPIDLSLFLTGRLTHPG